MTAKLLKIGNRYIRDDFKFAIDDGTDIVLTYSPSGYLRTLEGSGDIKFRGEDAEALRSYLNGQATALKVPAKAGLKAAKVKAATKAGKTPKGTVQRAG